MHLGQWTERLLSEWRKRKKGGMDPMSAVMPNPVSGTATQAQPCPTLSLTLSSNSSTSLTTETCKIIPCPPQCTVDTRSLSPPQVEKRMGTKEAKWMQKSGEKKLIHSPGQSFCITVMHRPACLLGVFIAVHSRDQTHARQARRAAQPRPNCHFLVPPFLVRK